MYFKASRKLLLATMMLTASLSLVHAELIENSAAHSMSDEQAKDYNTRNSVTRPASWKVQPDFTLPQKVINRLEPGSTYNVTLRLVVNKRGDIIRAYILKSSGNIYINQSMIDSAKKGKFYPFMRNGKPIKGTITLPINYKVPEIADTESNCSC